jgi:hypothetical protein
MRPSSQILYAFAEAVFRGQQFHDRADLARALGTTPSAVAPWAHRLAFHRILRDSPQGLTFDEDRLLNYLTSHRQANLQPQPEFFVPMAPEDAINRLAGLPHVLCMFTAGNRWAFFEPRGDLHVYIDRANVPALRRRLVRARRRGRQDTRVQIYIESLSTISHIDRTGQPTTTPLFTTIDLRAHPEGGAHAEFLRQNLLPRLRGAKA